MLFAPDLRTKEDIAAVVRAVDRPVNVMMGLPGVQLTVADLAQVGVTRVSLGAARARCWSRGRSAMRARRWRRPT